MQTRADPMMPGRAQPQGDLREVGIPRADAGLRNALRSAYALPDDMPGEFSRLLERLR